MEGKEEVKGVLYLETVLIPIYSKYVHVNKFQQCQPLLYQDPQNNIWGHISQSNMEKNIQYNTQLYSKYKETAEDILLIKYEEIK